MEAKSQHSKKSLDAHSDRNSTGKLNSIRGKMIDGASSVFSSVFSKPVIAVKKRDKSLAKPFAVGESGKRRQTRVRIRLMELGIVSDSQSGSPHAISQQKGADEMYDSSLPPELLALAKTGDRIYSEIDSEFLAAHEGYRIRINIETGKYVVGKSLEELEQRYCEKFDPDSLSWNTRIGCPAHVGFGNRAI